MTGEQRTLLIHLQACGNTGVELWAVPCHSLAWAVAAGCASLEFSRKTDQPALVRITTRGLAVLSDDPEDPHG